MASERTMRIYNALKNTNKRVAEYYLEGAYRREMIDKAAAEILRGDAKVVSVEVKILGEENV